jgi:uncharacterized tellurite resistance protein B-like protein
MPVLFYGTIKYTGQDLAVGVGLNDIAKHVTLLFLAVSAADRKILEEEVFLMEKCAADYDIKEDEWEVALNESFIKYFNQGEKAVLESILFLSTILDKNQKKELAEDLLAIALVDDVFHPNEKRIIKKVCKGFGINLKIPMEFLSV